MRVHEYNPHRNGERAKVLFLLRVGALWQTHSVVSYRMITAV